ncbi:MAG: hypothetical protein AB1390_10990 [Nitrospirota bacterium]
MRKIVFVVIGTLFQMLCASSTQSQTQVIEGYTFIRGATGPAVCLGRWVPPRDITLPGVCEGQLVDLTQLSAVSARLSADRLGQILLALDSLDQKLSINNDQIKQLIEVNLKTQTAIDQQVKQISNLLREAVTERFDALPAEILSNDLFKEELEKLKQDILKEVEKHYSGRSTPSTR